MFVCICHSVTDRQIRDAAAAGATCVDDLRQMLKVASHCGKCESCAREVLDQARHDLLAVPSPRFASATPAFP